MSAMITMYMEDDEANAISTNIGTGSAKTLYKHETGDGHYIKSIEAVPSVPGVVKVEIILDTDAREILKRLGVMNG